MIAIRRAGDRHYECRGKHEVWMTFSKHDGPGTLAGGFCGLVSFDESRVLPGARRRLAPAAGSEIVSYLLEGALAYEDSTGRSELMQAGEFQHIRSDSRTGYVQTNPSRTDSAHVFHLGLRPFRPELIATCVHKRFYAAERRGALCMIASPDGRRGSLEIGHDALIYSSLLASGQHLAHELPPDRSAWLHVVAGRAQLGEVQLAAGDGAGITAERAVSLTACAETELLLTELDRYRVRSGGPS